MSALTVDAWAVDNPGPIDGGPLRRVHRDVGDPGPGEIRVHVRVCGVCRTDLHLAEGDLPPKHRDVVPGHEVVGLVESVGEGSTRFAPGDRVGVPWLAHTCGVCRFCRSGRENLCVAPRFTGWDIDGGYAGALVAEEAYVYPIPDSLSDEQAAPLLCAGIIGYRALQRAELPPGGRLGIYGFGGSAHLIAQLAMADGARVHVLTRSAEDQELARQLGVTSVGGAGDVPPEPLDSAILFAPVGTLVPPALEALDRGGTLSVAGIYLTDIPSLGYERDLFQERTLRSVTANTRDDGNQFLETAVRAGVHASTRAYPFDEAPRALADLAHDRFNGAAVLLIDEE